MRSLAPARVLSSVRARAVVAAAAAFALTAAFAGGLASAHAAESYGAFSDTLTPAVPTDPDRAGVELGVQLSTSVAGDVTALQFYRGPEQTGAYTGTLWTGEGTALATTEFPASAEVGWQTAALAQPVHLEAGQSIVASYYAAQGAYPVTEGAFTSEYTVDGFTVPRGAGVYRYGESGFPTGSWRESNYFVDVVFTPDAEPTPQPTPTPSPTDPPDTLDLPRIAWEGGSDYWSQFPDAERWTDPSFFPIGVWWVNVSSDAEAQWDKDHGVNFYAGMWEGTDFSLLERNDQYWVGGRLNDTFDEDSPNWPGVFMEDEVDGWADSPEAGFGILQEIRDEWEGSGKFLYANYTSLVIGPDMPLAAQENYVNAFTDVVSADIYWHTAPFCDWTPYRGVYLAEPVPQDSCHASSSYGKTVTGLIERDAADGERQPVWNFVELLNPTPPQYGYDLTATGSQIQGAAMNSIINEARGLIYFNQSFGGPCPSGMAIRDAQTYGPEWCGAAQVEAMGEVNNFIHSLAPVLNTQSYEWSFGSGTDTMLKVHEGSAYIFAMTADGGSGQRSFTLPEGVDGAVVEVVGEDRTLAVRDGAFSDTFADADAYHVYRVSLAG